MWHLGEGSPEEAKRGYGTMKVEPPPDLSSSVLPGKLSLAVSMTTTANLAHTAVCTAVLHSLLLPLTQVAHAHFEW